MVGGAGAVHAGRVLARPRGPTVPVAGGDASLPSAASRSRAARSGAAASRWCCPGACRSLSACPVMRSPCCTPWWPTGPPDPDRPPVRALAPSCSWRPGRYQPFEYPGVGWIPYDHRRTGLNYAREMAPGRREGFKAGIRPTSRQLQPQARRCRDPRIL